MSLDPPRVLLHVQHLLGSGHQRRAAAVARALCAAGARVLYVSGGFPVPGLDTGPAERLQLAPVRAADASYARLLDEHGQPPDGAWWRSRRERLLAAFGSFRPHVLLVESFPFGRRVFATELLPLLHAAHRSCPRVRVFCSLRDIVEPRRKPGREEQTATLVEQLFDGVLVHADPAIVTLDASFGLAARIAPRLHYTGYVLEHEPPTGPVAPGGEVVVSAGGGSAGVDLLETALATQRRMPVHLSRWRVLVPHAVSGAVFERLAAEAAAGASVERNRDDFASLLRAAAVSVSQAGYNTLLEALAAGVPVVCVPFAQAGEREQGLRARLFAKRGLVEVVDCAALSPTALADAVTRAAARTRIVLAADMDGAAASARLMLEALAR